MARFLCPVQATTLAVLLFHMPLPTQESRPATRPGAIGRTDPATLDPDFAPGTALWLLRHQEPDGRWDPAGFKARCSGGRCDGEGHASQAVAATSLALLFMAEWGLDRHDSQVRKNLDAGLAWLASRQEEDGFIGHREEPHAFLGHMLATWALQRFTSEAWRPYSSRDGIGKWTEPNLRRAIEFLQAARSEIGRASCRERV